MKNLLRLTSFFFILSLYKQFICKRQVTQCVHKKCGSFLNFFSKNAYLTATLKTRVVPLISTVFTRISLLHLGQNVIAFRTLLHLGPVYMEVGDPK